MANKYGELSESQFDALWKYAIGGYHIEGSVIVASWRNGDSVMSVHVGTLKGFIKRGYIEPTGDGYSKVYKITEAGKAAWRKVYPIAYGDPYPGDEKGMPAIYKAEQAVKTEEAK
mgnify:FL=1